MIKGYYIFSNVWSCYSAAYHFSAPTLSLATASLPIVKSPLLAFLYFGSYTVAVGSLNALSPPLPSTQTTVFKFVQL